MPSTTNHPPVVPSETRLPPAPPGVRYVRVPMLGIVVATDRRRRRVDRFFHWPMIVLALAILPLLLIEFVKQPEGALRVAVQIGFAIIWLAFVVEFFVKVAIAESRPEYMRRNWLDIVIIVVPLLRPLRAARVVRTARVFKLRGVAMKFVRSIFTVVVGLEATERLLHRIGLKPRKMRTDPERMTRHQLETEVRRLRRLSDRWEDWWEAHETHVAEHGGPCVILPKPEEEAEAPADGVASSGSVEGASGCDASAVPRSARLGPVVTGPGGSAGSPRDSRV